MKKLFTLALISISLIGFSQGSSIKENEIGVNIFSVVDARGTTGSLDFSKANYTSNYVFASGIMYKHHWGNNSIRIGIDYYHNAIINEPSLETPVDLTYLKFDNRIGYQRVFGTSKFKPFMAIDAVVGVVRRNEKWTNFYTYPLVTTEHIGFSYEVGFAPTIGFQYQFNPLFSVTVETSINAGGLLLNKDGKLEGNGAYYYFNPVRLLSINYHF